MELNKEELIELGFVELTGTETYYYYFKQRVICFLGSIILIKMNDYWEPTNAKTIQDINDLIRLFK